MIIVVPMEQLDKSLSILSAHGENAWHIGEISELAKGEEQVVINQG